MPDEVACGEYVHKIANPNSKGSKGYRPGRKTGGRQNRKQR